ncbi:hypothetical protein [Plantactinospora soyae]|uniref:Calcium-binding protein n=1 Tax=Plantactinospora soyae TaxID=1544732 RepID=A0A927R6T3_9ACTN|nr:hypothetical protein [Plantactinospora soyae]MBE1487201.1 hypothetical protein [Plantactinospora soyae]
MSDFDVVLERLVADPAFAAALSVDPVGTLAGYRLDADELALLQLQLGDDVGGQHGVETRANQSSLFGMFTPLVGLAGALPAVNEIGTSGLGRPSASAEGFGTAVPVQGLGATSVPGQGFGAAPVPASGALAGPVDGFGTAPGCAAPAVEAGAGAPVGGLAGLGDEIGRSIGSATDAALAAPGGGLGATLADPAAGLAAALAGAETGFGAADPPFDVEPPSDAEPAVPDGYRTRVDIDGDGDWDRHTLHGRADGGVDILVDADRDGRTDFVGHDLDADGLVDIGEYDKNRDGFFEKRMYDDDGDGWMDRTVRAEPPADSGY